jgi:glycosyltransferase involved in cell wall biosynthesis
VRICLVGGIFGQSPEYQRTVTATPETTLLKGLRSRGVVVEPRGHYGPFDYQDFDVVHVHHLSYGALIAAGERGRNAFIFTPHLDRARSFSRNIAMRYVIRRADTVVALSETEVAWQRKKWAARPERQVVIPNGIDSSTFTFVTPDRASRGPWRILYVGQLARHKGIYDLLDAAALLTNDLAVDLDLRLVYHIAVEEAELRTYARRLGLTKIHFLGARTPAELSRIYADSHFLVVPSRSMEALPSVITEAMLVGRPVIATDVAGIREQLAGFGIVTRPGAPAELARAMRSMVTNYQLYASRAHAATQSARERFSIDRMVDSHAAVYDLLSAQDRSDRIRLPHSLAGSVGRFLAARSARVSSSEA